jgi:hypothetical protein
MVRRITSAWCAVASISPSNVWIRAKIRQIDNRIQTAYLNLWDSAVCFYVAAFLFLEPNFEPLFDPVRLVFAKALTRTKLSYVVRRNPRQFGAEQIGAR